MRGDHTGKHPYPQGHPPPGGSGESIPRQGQIGTSGQPTLPWGRLVFAGLAGLLAGLLGMMLHASSTSLEAFRLPWGLIVGLLAAYTVVFQSGIYGGQVHPRYAVTGAFTAWAAAVFVNFIGFFVPGDDIFFLPAPLGHNPFASWPIFLDRAWQAGLFVILPIVTWHLLQVLRREKD